MALGAGATAASSEASHTRSLVNTGEGSSRRPEAREPDSSILPAMGVGQEVRREGALQKGPARPGSPGLQ